MKKFIFLIVVALLASSTKAQSDQDRIRDKKVQMNRQDKVTHNYVNFDVVKVLLGSGLVRGYSVQNNFPFCFKFQFLWPKSFFKDKFPIALGFNIGHRKISLSSQRFEISNSIVTGVSDHPTFSKSKIKTATYGIVIMKVFQMKNKCRLLAGISIDYNGLSKLKTYDNLKIAKQKISNIVNRISIPANIQYNLIHKSVFSLGLFGSYEITPAFKSNKSIDLKRTIVGISTALII